MSHSSCRRTLRISSAYAAKFSTLSSAISPHSLSTNLERSTTCLLGAKISAPTCRNFRAVPSVHCSLANLLRTCKTVVSQHFVHRSKKNPASQRKCTKIETTEPHFCSRKRQNTNLQNEYLTRTHTRYGTTKALTHHYNQLDLLRFHYYVRMPAENSQSAARASRR